MYNIITDPMKNVSFSSNEIKVYENSCLKVKQETALYSLTCEFDEILELIDLFSANENDEKIQKMQQKIDKYENLFIPAIKETGRILKNTIKRLDYNTKKC